MVNNADINTRISSCEINIAREGDVDNVVAIINDAYWKYQKDYFTDTPESRERITREGVVALIKDSTKSLFVLMDKTRGAIVGTILLECPEEKAHARIGLFALTDDVRGKGVGSRLMQHAEAQAKKKGRKFMKIEVFTFAPHLAAYYNRLGYTLTGKEKTFFHASCIKPEFQKPDKHYLQKLRKEL